MMRDRHSRDPDPRVLLCSCWSSKPWRHLVLLKSWSSLPDPHPPDESWGEPASLVFLFPLPNSSGFDLLPDSDASCTPVEARASSGSGFSCRFLSLWMRSDYYIGFLLELQYVVDLWLFVGSDVVSSPWFLLSRVADRPSGSWPQLDRSVRCLLPVLAQKTHRLLNVRCSPLIKHLFQCLVEQWSDYIVLCLSNWKIKNVGLIDRYAIEVEKELTV